MGIPDILGKKPQWVLWKYEKAEPKPKKVPYQANGQRADITNPNHLNNYGEISFQMMLGGYSGIGFVFTASDDLVGIDLDNVAENGILNQEAQEILNTLNSYAEWSPSKKGIHIICRGKLPPGSRRKGFIEMYDRGRYFTFTGDKINDLNVESRTQELLQVHSKYLGKQDGKQEKPQNNGCDVQSLSELEIITKAGQAKNGDTFNCLYRGDFSGYNSQSEADIALCNMLAFWTGRNAQMMDNIFRNSGLYREKWDKKHSTDGRTYGEMTINNAIDQCVDTYKLPKAKQNKPTKSVELINAEDINPETINWLWHPYIPQGKVVLMAADPGTGKTWLALYIIAHLSKGGYYGMDTMFNGTRFSPSKCLYITAEDGLGDTIVPRLMRMGANLKNISLLGPDSVLGLDDPGLHNVIREYKPKLAVLDPLQAFIGVDKDMNKANDMRSVLGPVVALAHETQTSFLIIAHNNKTVNLKSLHKVVGSIDMIGAARSVLSVINMPESVFGQKAMGHIKSNLAPQGDTILFHIENTGVVFDGFSEKNIDDILYPKIQTREKGAPALDEAVEFLQEFLADGEKTKDEIIKAAYDKGISDMTLQRARPIVGIESERTKVFPSKTIWKLSEKQQNI